MFLTRVAFAMLRLKSMKFIVGVNRVLNGGGRYILTCFSYGIGQGWNNFKTAYSELFSGPFELRKIGITLLWKATA